MDRSVSCGSAVRESICLCMLGGIKGVPSLVNCKHGEGECDRDESVAYKVLMVEDYMEWSKVK